MSLSNADQLKRNYFWNTMGSLMSSFSSVLLLVVVTRELVAYVAGIFCLAYALGQQFQTLGQFEMRPYQVTDVKTRYSFATYLGSRYLTCTAMIACLLVYSIATNGFGEDAALLLMVASLKLFDAFEDVFHGLLQQRGRLDLAGRAFFFRVLITTVSFVAGVVVCKDLMHATLIAILASLVSMLLLNVPQTLKFETLVPSFSWRHIVGLLLACLPLFLSSFLLNDIVNVPRYGIEGVLSKDSQTIYSILYMPALVINMLVGFLFKPLLTNFAEYWELGQRSKFFGLVRKGMVLTFLVSAISAVVAWLFGIPVLSWFYAVDLSAYRFELMTVMLGGLFNALGVILYYALVTMRLQKLVVVGYALSAGVAHLVVTPLINTFNIMGAFVTYDLSTALLVVIFAIEIVLSMKFLKGGNA